jgi:hypothetical protein
MTPLRFITVVPLTASFSLVKSSTTALAWLGAGELIQTLRIMDKL